MTSPRARQQPRVTYLLDHAGCSTHEESKASKPGRCDHAASACSGWVPPNSSNSRETRKPAENFVESRFSSFREAHFALGFPCEWSGPWNHMRTSKVFGKSERVDDFLQFRSLICLLFERSKKSHDLQEIIDFPELTKNLVHVSRNFLPNFCRK